tara:strand:+ start:673 stop:861 length:189 start_codon:yes stop_codon:yes gene_type:complete
MEDYIQLLEVKPLYKCYFGDNSYIHIHKDSKLMKESLEMEEKGAYQAYMKYMYHAGVFLEFG